MEFTTESDNSIPRTGINCGSGVIYCVISIAFAIIGVLLVSVIGFQDGYTIYMAVFFVLLICGTLWECRKRYYHER